MSLNMLMEVVENIVAAADEIKAQETQDAQDFGELLAYAEALTIIQEACAEEVRKKIGLDFDIDKRYLIG